VVSEIGKPLKWMRHSADAATFLRPRGSEGRVVEGLGFKALRTHGLLDKGRADRLEKRNL